MISLVLLLLALAFFVLLLGGLALLARSLSGGSRRAGADEDLALLEQLSRGLQQLTKRVEALETLLSEEPKPQPEEDSAVHDRVP